MKRLIYTILILGILVTGAGCKKFLSLDPPSDLSGNNFWKSTDDVERFTSGMYELFRQSVFRQNMTAADPSNDPFPFFAWGGDLRGAPVKVNTDRAYIAFLANNDIRTVVNSLPNGFSEYFKAKRFTQWDRFFKVIASANIAIDKIPNVPGLSSGDKDRYLGEAAFLRNLVYFFMVRLWGDVPYYTEPYFTGDLKRLPMTQVLQKCDADMEKYKGGLPWTYNDPTQVAVRGMKGSAIALQMHINMWLASFDNTHAEKYYTRVDSLGNEILNQSGNAYTLLPLSNTHAIFKGRSKEGLFEIPQNVNYGESFGYAAYSDLVLRFPYVSFNLRNSYMSYEPKFMEEIYPPAGADLRKNAWFEPNYMYSGTGSFVMIKYSNAYANQFAEDVKPDDNQPVFRLPDVYLLKAEALAQLGKGAEALTAANVVRKRAGAPPFTDTDKQTLLDNIFYERCRELMGEGHYWYDVVRTRRITDVEYKYGYHCSVEQFNAGAWTWPIDPVARINNPGIVLNNYWQ